MGFVETSDALQYARTKQLAAQSNKVPVSKQVGQGILANHRSVDIFLLLPGFTGPTKSLPIGINHVSRAAELFNDLKFDFARMKEIVGIQELDPCPSRGLPAPIPGGAWSAVLLAEDPVTKLAFPQSILRYLDCAVS